MNIVEPEEPEDDEEVIDFGEFRPIRVRGLNQRSKTSKFDWDDDDG